MPYNNYEAKDKTTTWGPSYVTQQNFLGERAKMRPIHLQFKLQGFWDFWL